MALSLHWNPTHPDDTDNSRHGSVCTLKSQSPGQYWQQSSWLSLHWNHNHQDNTDSSPHGCLYTEITITRTILTAVIVPLSLHWNHKRKLDTGNNTHGSFFTLKSQTLGQYWQQFACLCLYTEITNNRTKLAILLMALSVHWNHKQKDSTDSSPRGSVFTLKSQKGQLWEQSLWHFPHCNHKYSLVTTLNCLFLLCWGTFTKKVTMLSREYEATICACCNSSTGIQMQKKKRGNSQFYRWRRYKCGMQSNFWSSPPTPAEMKPIKLEDMHTLWSWL